MWTKILKKSIRYLEKVVSLQRIIKREIQYDTTKRYCRRFKTIIYQYNYV